MSDPNHLDIENDFLGYIPELPEVAGKFIALTRQLNTVNKLYANLLLSDALLSTRLFSYINLTLCQGDMSYMSLNKGLSLVGLHEAKNIVLVFSLFPLFEEANCIDLFKYSLTSAFYSKKIALEYNLINPQDAFLLGFLHDIGRIVMKNKFKDKYLLPAFPYSDFRDEDSFEKEIQKFGCNHADLSEFILKKWRLPLIICDSVKYHHSPLKAMLPQAASILYLSDILCKKNTRLSKNDLEIFDYMHFTKSGFGAFIPECDRQTLPYFNVLNI